MAPRNRSPPVDVFDMELKFMSKRRPATQCKHTSEVRLEIAGLVRSVCETCGRVSVDVVEDRFSPERRHGPGPLVPAAGSGPIDG